MKTMPPSNGPLVVIRPAPSTTTQRPTHISALAPESAQSSAVTRDALMIAETLKMAVARSTMALRYTTRREGPAVPHAQHQIVLVHAFAAFRAASQAHQVAPHPRLLLSAFRHLPRFLCLLARLPIKGSGTRQTSSLEKRRRSVACLPPAAWTLAMLDSA